MSEALFWILVGPLIILGGMLVIGVLFGNSSSGDYVEPQCGPSRQTRTARQDTKHTSYASKRYRWHGLERAKKREKVKRG